MSSDIQPGLGYGFTSGGFGFSLDTTNPFQDEVYSPCILEAYNIRKDGEEIKFNVYPGMVNNLVVKSNDMVLLTNDPPPDIPAFTDGVTTEQKLNYVYIRCGFTAGGGSISDAYPSTSGEGYPSVRVFSEKQTDSETYGYVLIAVLVAQKILIPESDPPDYNYELSIERMIGCNSIWTERFKCGSSAATYWWSAV